jgi:general secretion pathway protein N
MMSRPWKFVLFFLLFLILALLVNLPVQQVIARVDLPASLRLSGISGTLFNGRVDLLTVNQFPLRDIRYSFMPSCLPILKLCYQIDYDQGSFQMAYDVVNGDSEISDSRVEYPVAELLARFPATLAVKPSGSLQLEIDEMSMRENKLEAVNGRLVWRDLGVNQGEVQINIGDYQVDFSGDNQKYELKFSDLDAKLDVSGDGRITADGQYQVDVRVDSESTIDSQVRTVLELIGKRSSVNKYRIEQQGRLPPTITRQLFP